MLNDKRATHLGSHDPIHPSQLDTPIHILPVQDIPIRKHGHLDGLLDRLDLPPIRQALQVPQNIPTISPTYLPHIPLKRNPPSLLTVICPFISLVLP